MALFGLFKSKQERELDGVVKHINDMSFPGGEKDIKRDCDRIDALTNGKIPAGEFRGFLMGCKALLTISESQDGKRFTDSFVVRSKGRITEQEAFDMYAYLEGEARFYDVMSMMAGKMGNLGDMGDAVSGDMPFTYAKGVRTNSIPGGMGEYGLSVDNPIPTISTRCSERYLARLRFRNSPVEWERLGSGGTKVTPGRVDMYRLAVRGGDVGTIYICPYHKRNSGLAPKGFSLV